MSPLRSVFLLLLLAGWSLILSGLPARGLTVAALGNFSGLGNTSLAVVDGRPAAAWVDIESQSVKYVRALDADGTVWGAPVAAMSGGISSRLQAGVTLRVVNGRPAICCAAFPGGLFYIRAQDGAGAAWPSAPVTLSNGFARPVMEVINGKPAVLARIGNNAHYFRAVDADGRAWEASVIVGSVYQPLEFDLKEVEGRPAMVNSNTVESSTLELKFVRALDADGTAWGAPVVLPVTINEAPCALQVVEGRPAVACFAFDGSSAQFRYLRALTPDGASWGSPVTVQSSPVPAGILQMPQLSFAVVNGTPAMAVLTPLRQLFFTRAADPAGSSWQEAASLDTGGLLVGASLVEVNGRPAVAYTDLHSQSVKYLRAGAGADAAGTQWPPDLNVFFRTILFRDAVNLEFDNTAVNGMRTETLTLRNPGVTAADLHITGLTLTGTGAADFKVLIPPPSPVPGGSETQMVVAYAPLSPGEKSAQLQIATDTGTGTSPFVAVLKGRTLPDISVERPGGSVVPPAGAVQLPATHVGGQTNIALMVRNTGFAELQGLDAIFTSSSHSGEFSIVQPLPDVLAPGAAAPLVIRHAATASGPKTAAYMIVSNAPSPRHQYWFSLNLHSGTVDETFASEGGSFFCVALEPGGRILAGGDGSVAAFRADGSPDPAFFAPVINGKVVCLAVQRDGGIIAGGSFSLAGGLERRHLVRLLPDGAVDPFFDAQVWGPVNALAVLPNDKILAGGALSARPVPVPPSLLRLMPDGTPDHTFQCSLTDTVLDIAVQTDGSVLVCSISPPDGTPVQLFHEDGSEAPLSLQLTGRLRAAVRRPDGVLTGTFWDGGLMRFDGTGLPAPGYVQTLRSGRVFGLALQADGACPASAEIFGGALLQRSVGRVRADGSDDDGFFASTDSVALKFALQEDGKPVLAGSFTRVNDESVFRPGLVRLNNEPSVSILNRQGSTAVRWMRGGTAPEVSDVSFEMNTPGGGGGNETWTLLGFGTRIAGGWELTGLNLPETCRIRARGRAGGSLTQGVVSYPPPLEAWRLAHFGTTASTGSAANDADPDNDGLTNLIEFAFDLNPVDGGGSALPAFTLTEGGFTATFTAPEDREAVLYRAAWSVSMVPGTWTPVPDAGVAPHHVFHAPAGGRVFVRWEVELR